MPEEKKKSLFDKAIDALTNRDEQEAPAGQAKALADAARNEADARAEIAAEKAAADKAAAEKAAIEKAATDTAAAQKTAAETAAAIAAPKKGVVNVRSLRIRADHNITSEVIGGLVKGNEVTILSTWSDGTNTWAKLEKGWAAMVYEGETYIKVA